MKHWPEPFHSSIYENAHKHYNHVKHSQKKILINDSLLVNKNET